MPRLRRSNVSAPNTQRLRAGLNCGAPPALRQSEGVEKVGRFALAMAGTVRGNYRTGAGLKTGAYEKQKSGHGMPCPYIPRLPQEPTVRQRMGRATRSGDGDRLAGGLGFV